MLIQLLRVLWARWKAFGHMVATFQARVLLFVFYYVILGPFALAMRGFSDPLGLRPDAGAAPGWLERPAPTHDATLQARRQS
jgi:hypothetical protein